MNKKLLYTIDAVLLISTALTLLYLTGYVNPLVIAPLDGLSTTNNSVLFVFEKGNTIYLDDNSEFTSPEKIIVENDLVINLKPGKYYWKVVGVRESEIRTLTVNSEVDFRLIEDENEIKVVNFGTEELEVDVYSNETKVNTFTLGINEEGNVSGNKVVGGVS